MSVPLPAAPAGGGRAVVVWGTQLSLAHNTALARAPEAPVVLIESLRVCRRYRYHRQKLRFVLTAMREFGDELTGVGRTVWYRRLDEAHEDWFTELGRVCRARGVRELVVMRTADRTPQRRLEAWCRRAGIRLTVTSDGLFLTAQDDFAAWAEGRRGFRMETFYRWQRARLGVLMDGDSPEGGRWNHDADNRRPLPHDVHPPPPAPASPSRHLADVTRLVERFFPDHPGDLDPVWLPTTRAGALARLDDFVTHRLPRFGPYEDAMRPGEPFVFHSLLSPLLNVGLLHPAEVVAAAADADAPLNSREGFVRQVIGWREFVFGLYHLKGPEWIDRNHLGHTRRLPAWWWRLDAPPEPALADAIARLRRYGYTHHIERLMLFGNHMLLSRIRPRDVFTWFMCMYVDAYEWVMVANVIGMSQYADGGADHGGFATKPYISGANYLQRMGGLWPSASAARESGWTEMYWRFLEDHRDVLESNRRLAPLYRTRPATRRRDGGAGRR